jgi:preprotein translocase subunit SecE
MSRQLKKKSAIEKAIERKKKSVQEDKEKAVVNSQSSLPANTSSGLLKALTPKLEKKIPPAPVVTPNGIQRAIEFFREVKLELSKVIWPLRKQVAGTTVVVIIFVLIVSTFLGLFDLGLSSLVQAVLT